MASVEARRRPLRSGTSSRLSRTALALALALASAGCAKDITVTLRAGDRPADPNAQSSTAATSRARALVAGVAVDRVRFAFRGLRLQMNPTADGSPSVGDQPLVSEILLVDLSGGGLSPGAMTEIVSARDVSWDSYYQAVLEVGPVTEDDAAADPALAPLTGRTVVVEGRLPGGAPFTFESPVSAVLVLPVVFRTGLNHNNLTLNIALDEWFEGDDGEPLDPTDPAVRPVIESNILESINTYMDDNRDGDPDVLG
jgi:hypothetical protein